MITLSLPALGLVAVVAALWLAAAVAATIRATRRAAAAELVSERVAWLENQTPFRHSGIDDRPHARGPPAYS